MQLSRRSRDPVSPSKDGVRLCGIGPEPSASRNCCPFSNTQKRRNRAHSVVQEQRPAIAGTNPTDSRVGCSEVTAQKPAGRIMAADLGARERDAPTPPRNEAELNCVSFAFRAGKKIMKDGRHVGLEVYDLLIEAPCEGGGP